ncbi:MAG: hypothetical protein HY283_04365 [Nitrospirae bacterium]|nr:hypothetical protein [Nitrospirota bacterium]
MFTQKIVRVIRCALGLPVVMILSACSLPAVDMAGAKNPSIDLKRLHRAVIDDQYVGAYPSIVAAEGQLFVSYYVARYGEDWGGLKYAHQANGVWSTVYVDVPVNGDVGRNTSLARDSKGNIHISYWDVTRGGVKYAVYQNGSWEISTVDQPGHHGRGTSLAIDSRDRVYIAYYGEGAIHLAERTPEGWKLSRIAEVGEVHMYPSLVIDSADHLHLVFFDRLTGRVNYAVQMLDGWRVQTVASVGEDGKPAPKLVLDHAGRPHVIFYDTHHGELKYATQKGSAWGIEVIDHIGDIGYDPNLNREDSIGSTPSLLVDAEDNLHVSYYYGTEHDLRYGVRRNGQWATTVIDSEGDVGRYSTLTVDSQKTVHIVYRDSTHNQLKYASF